MAISREITELIQYDSLNTSTSTTLTGNYEAAIKETVAFGGGSSTINLTVALADIQAIFITSTSTDQVTVTTSAADVILTSGTKSTVWYSGQVGGTNPVTADFTSLTIANAGAEDADVEIRILIDD